MDRLLKLRNYIDPLDHTTGNGNGNRRSVTDEIPEFPGEDEVARLSRSVTGTVARLERALQQQRRFASDTSHELRSPIAGLRARLEEAQLHPNEVSLEDVVEEALQDVDRLETIVTDLLLLSRIEASGHANGHGNGNGHGGNANAARKLETVDLAELVREEVSRRRDRLTVELHLQPGVRVDGVRSELGRVLTNLLDNAQRHADHLVEVDVHRDGDGAQLSVCDDGEGIAEADREQIFERFTRLGASRERDRGGSGLGLAISRDIAHAHHGTIEVGESASGGARFVLRLPLSR
jgi:signal transduction histidine kinase